MKITSRMVAPGIGLSWGEGVLTYKDQDYPFTFHATGFSEMSTARSPPQSFPGRCSS